MRMLLPDNGTGLKIGVGIGRFAELLEIKYGFEAFVYDSFLLLLSR
jgi:hypothetical protein